MQLLGAVPDAVHLGEARLDVARVDREPAAGEPGVQLDGLLTDEPGVLHRPVGGHQGLGSGPVQRAPARDVRQDVGVHGGRLQPSHQVFGGGEFLPAVTAGEALHHQGALHPEPRGAQRVPVVVQETQGLLREGQGPFAVSTEARRDRGLRHQVEVAERVLRRLAAAARVGLGVVQGPQGRAHGVGYVVPELHGPLQQPELLAVREAAPGFHRCPEHGGQRLARVVCGVPVAGEARGALVGADERRVAFQRFRVTAVEARAFAGQQVVADGLADQGVPEAVAVGVGRGQQEVGADRRAQRLVEVVLGEAGDGGEERMLDRGAALGDDPGDPLRVLGQGLDPYQEQVAQGVGEP